jgi:hypothetical protein
MHNGDHMHGNTFVFHFEGDEVVELVQSEVRLAGEPGKRSCFRGKTPGAYHSDGSFQWTSGVRAVCVAFMKMRLSGIDPELDTCVVGDRASMAASLDYALSKRPVWLEDMFGVGSGGRQNAQRIFRVTNPNRKRPGPVALSVNSTIILPENISIFWHNKKVDDPDLLRRMIDSIERQDLLAREATGRAANQNVLGTLFAHQKKELVNG